MSILCMVGYLMLAAVVVVGMAGISYIAWDLGRMEMGKGWKGLLILYGGVSYFAFMAYAIESCG